jgi:hypothetical protein
METRSAPGSLGWNREKAALALLSFAMLIVSLGQYMVVVALPDIARDLGYSAQTLQSVISAYAVASAGFLLFGGRAADLLGGAASWPAASHSMPRQRSRADSRPVPECSSPPAHFKTSVEPSSSHHSGTDQRHLRRRPPGWI